MAETSSFPAQWRVKTFRMAAALGFGWGFRSAEASGSSSPTLRGASPGRIGSAAGPLLLLAVEHLLLAKLGRVFAPGLPIEAYIWVIFLWICGRTRTRPLGWSLLISYSWCWRSPLLDTGILAALSEARGPRQNHDMWDSPPRKTSRPWMVARDQERRLVREIPTF